MAAFAAYEGILFAISAMSATGLSNFAPAVVLRIFLINASSRLLKKSLFDVVGV